MKKLVKAVCLLTVTVLVAATAAACATISQFVGHWHLSVDKNSLPSMTEEETSALLTLVDTMTFDLTIRGNGTATASGTMIQSSESSQKTSGAAASWTAEGNVLTLKAPSGESSDKDIVLTLKDGKLYFDAAYFGPEASYLHLEKD